MSAFQFSGPSESVINQISVENAQHDYASIFVADGAIAQGSLGTTPQQATGFITNGPAFGLIADAANDRIVVATSGVYFVGLQSAFSGSVNAIFEVHLRVNGVEQPEGFHRRLSGGGDVGSASFFAIRLFNANDVLTIWIETDEVMDTDTWTPVDMQFIVFSLPQSS